MQTVINKTNAFIEGVGEKCGELSNYGNIINRQSFNKILYKNYTTVDKFVSHKNVGWNFGEDLAIVEEINK